MPRKLIGDLIQATAPVTDPSVPIDKIRKAAIDAHIPVIEEGLSQYLWKLEQPAHAVANGYFMACSNRVGTEAPWSIGRFYGSSYFVDPRGNLIAMGSEDKDELVVAEMDLDMIEEVRRVWQFYRDRRPETSGSMAEQLR